MHFIQRSTQTSDKSRHASRRTTVDRMLAVWSALLLGVAAQAQQTVGLFIHENQSLDSGYVLFAPQNNAPQNKLTYLIDKCGKLIHTWPSQYNPNASVYLLPDGSILRAGAYSSGPVAGGIIEKIDWSGKLVWHYAIADTLECQHHDIYPLPNGNVLALARDIHTPAEAIAIGRDTTQLPDKLWSEEVVELKPIGSDSALVVWKWRVWDHLIQNFSAAKPSYATVADHPELINVNFAPQGIGQSDWMHMNAVAYNPVLDQIVLSNHNFNEIWIVDHSTTTAEAASHSGGKQGKGGDLLYRWGNPAAYDQGTASDQRLFGQHSPYWIPAGYPHAGHLMIFNNGLNRPGGRYSSVEILVPPCDSTGKYDASTIPFLPAASDWILADTSATIFFSNTISGASMLTNGNVLICSGETAKFIEMESAEQEIVWKYVSPIGATGPVQQGQIPKGQQTFRCLFYPYSYPAFRGRSMPAGSPLEIYPWNYECTLHVDTSHVSVQTSGASIPDNRIFMFPNPAIDRVDITGPEVIDAISVVDFMGNTLMESHDRGAVDITALPRGVYGMRIRSRGVITTKVLAVVK